MFSQGLSLDQAPPLPTVLRFFLTLPFFGFIGGLSLLWIEEWQLGRWESIGMVGVVHLVVLGFAATAMVGALFQMLPVIAGAKVPNPGLHSRWIHLFMVVGTLLLAAAFLLEGPGLLTVGPALLLLALGHVTAVMFSRLLRVENKTPSVVGMIAALASLGFGLIFALLATLALMGIDVGMLPTDLRTIHLHFMLFGWIATLIMAVAFQVIEMFYVTPPYPEMVRRWFPGAMLAVLVVQVPLYLVSYATVMLLDWVVAALLAIFAAVTLKRLSQRKRPVADATVWLWRTGMGALLTAAFCGMAATVVDHQAVFDLAVVAFGYFFVSIILAMSYKIVPFLIWFHLNAKGVLETPMMGDIIPAAMARWQLWVHWAVGAALALAPFWSWGWRAAGALFAAESLLFGYNLFKAAAIYRRLKDKGVLS